MKKSETRLFEPQKQHELIVSVLQDNAWRLEIIARESNPKTLKGVYEDLVAL
jgi:transcription elongation factor GreA-like protein